MIIKCRCKHEYQDQVLGQGNRQHTPTLKGKGGPVVYRCTVCELERVSKEGSNESGDRSKKN